MKMKYSFIQPDYILRSNNFIKLFIISILQITISTLIVLLVVDSIEFYKCRSYTDKFINNEYEFIEDEEYQNNDIILKHYSAVEGFRKCADNAYNLYTDVDKYVHKYRECIQEYIPTFEFDKFKMGRFDEYKVFLPLKSDFPQNECNWITVGVGGDSLVEKEFKEKYPGCNVFGVEASPDQYVDFANYGTIIPYGVGVTNSTVELTVRKGTRYFQQTVEVLAMADLLDKFVKTRHIQYMTIDIEGFEYNILEELIRGRRLANQGVVFCQIDAELHGFDNTHEKIREFVNLFNDEKSDYLPVYNVPFIRHQKITFVNFRDNECKRAFNFEPLL